MTGDRHQAAPGVTEVRLSGQPKDTSALVAVLDQLADGQPAGNTRIEILTWSAPARRAQHSLHQGSLVFGGVRALRPGPAEQIADRGITDHLLQGDHPAWPHREGSLRAR